MSENKKGKVKIVDAQVIKSGEKNDRKWVMSDISFILDGKQKTLRSFDNFSDKIGEEVDVIFTPREWEGKTYWNITLPKESVWKAVRELEKRVEVLEVFVIEQGAEKVGEGIQAEMGNDKEIDPPF